METIDITSKAKRLIKYGLVGMIILSTAVGFAAFNYKHNADTLKIDNAKVAGTMVSMRVLTNGKVKELTKSDGDEVKAGDVIARIEVSVTEEQIEQLEKAVDLAKTNYAQLQVGQMVKVPVRKPKVKTVQTPKPATQSAPRSSANVAALEERKNRLELLYEMGAISRKELEAAVKEYELAKAAANSNPVADVPQSSDSTEIEYEIEYVEQLQPTPPEILNGAQLAIKQAELSLNVAKQESQQTEVIAPVDGTIYYDVSVDEEVQAGEVVARIGDSHELWLEAEVTETQFDKLSLGKLVSYVIDGNNLTGTVIEKIAPKDEEEVAAEVVETLTSPAPTENPTQQATGESQPSSTDLATDGTQLQAENSDASAQPVPAQSTEAQTNEAADNTETKTENSAQPKMEENPNRKDKYIVKFSMPANFECKPNTNVAVTVKL